MSNAILYRMAQGVQGAITRQQTALGSVEPQAFNSSLPFPSYGVPGKMVSGLFVPLSAVGDTAPYGFLVRPYPIVGLNASDALGVAVPLCTGGVAANILRRGYMSIVCNAGTPVQGGTLYMRYANPSGALVLGGIEATSVGGSNVALTNVQFTGPADSAGNVEIAFNI